MRVGLMGRASALHRRMPYKAGVVSSCRTPHLSDSLSKARDRFTMHPTAALQPQRCVAARAASAVARVQFRVPKRVSFGQSLSMVTSKSGWQPDPCLKMQWSEGDQWNVSAELDPECVREGGWSGPGSRTPMLPDALSRTPISSRSIVYLQGGPGVQVSRAAWAGTGPVGASGGAPRASF